MERNIGKREQEVLELVAKGLTNSEIAKILGRSPKTVENHVRSLLMKLRANNRTHLIVEAIKEGVLPHPKDM